MLEAEDRGLMKRGLVELEPLELGWGAALEGAVYKSRLRLTSRFSFSRAAMAEGVCVDRVVSGSGLSKLVLSVKVEKTLSDFSILFQEKELGACVPEDDNCRKKRCADRYDSSESSDR